MSEPKYLPTLDKIEEQKALIKEDHMIRRRQEPRQYYGRGIRGIREYRTRIFHGELVIEDL